LVNETDMNRLIEFGNALNDEFKTNLAHGKITATNVRGKSRTFAAEKVSDGDAKTYWATDDGITTGSLELDFGKDVEFNRVLVQENIALGQRVKKFSVQILDGKDWRAIAEQTTIGYKRILRFPKERTRKLRFVIEDAKACPTITNIEIFDAPEAR